MAINKDKNINLQITLSKKDAELLNDIAANLTTLLNIDLSKSQTIAFLIRNYGKNPLNNNVNAVKQREDKPTAKANNKAINYQAQIKALKDKLNVSFTELERITGISASTLKKYASGTQQPKAKNEQLLLNALKVYGIQ